jgi:aspartate aminotransferase
MSVTSALQIADRMSVVRESATVALGDRARAMKAAGRDLIDMAGGEPDFDSPQSAIEAAAAALRSSFTHYVASRGIPEFRRAIAEKLKRENGLTYDPDREIVVTVGAKLALLSTFLASLNPGDEAICFTPAWVSYEPMLALAGARMTAVPLRLERGRFVFDPEALAAAVTPRTRAIVINSPNNPTGKVLTDDELSLIARTARDANLMLIADEIYEHILYDGRRHTSPAALEGMRDRTVTINGMSKAYAMTGWRLGYVAADAKLVSAIVTMQQQMTTCATSFAQKGAAVALSSGLTDVAPMVREFARRRDFLVERFQRIPALELPTPEGAFYGFPRIRQAGADSALLAARLLEEAEVAMVPGAAFGPGGEGHLRFSFACAPAELERACDRLEKFFAGWPTS